MTELPERIWAGKTILHSAQWTREPAPGFQAYILEDAAILKAEADATVAAAVDACAEVIEECGIDGSAFAQTFEEYRRGRAAFEKAVQEAVEAERERCAQVALRHFGYEPSEEEMHTVMDIAAAIRSQHEPSE